MAVFNVTPDSFYARSRVGLAGSQEFDERVLRAVEEGADILDIGGESTRPGALPVESAKEMDRVLPAIDRIRQISDVLISVDTSNPELIRELTCDRADLINDVRALQKEGALAAAAASQLPVCLMHMQNSPQTMQDDPSYESVVAEVYDFLAERKAQCIDSGIDASRVLVDPGFGFGKTDAHNLALLTELERFKALGPVLAGLSRKSLIGRLLNRDTDERLPASVALACEAVSRGARVIRVHDVAASRDAIDMAWLVREFKIGGKFTPLNSG